MLKLQKIVPYKKIHLNNIILCCFLNFPSIIKNSLNRLINNNVQQTIYDFVINTIILNVIY